MHGSFPRNTISAIPVPASNRPSRQDFAEPLWFAVLCRYLWGANGPKDLQAALARNGLERSDRTCRAWASGDNTPPLQIYLVLQNDAVVGSRVLHYAHQDCTAPWWQELQRAVRIAAQVDKMDLS
jgi:hypothetical protein